MNGAQITIEALKREGIDHVFALPGTTTMHLLDALYQDGSIRYISVRHEQAAAFMADGYYRGSGRPAVAMASRGPGAANMTSAMHNAHAESVPIVALLGQVADNIAYRDAFEEIDLIRFYEPLTKWGVEIHQVERIAELVQRAVRTAVAGRARPVAISIPMDVQKAACVEPAFQKPFPRPVSVPAQGDVEAAARVLAGARRPFIVAGGGVRSARAQQALVAVAEFLGAPVATTYKRKTVFPGDHPLYLGGLGPGALSITRELLKEADAVLAVGCRFSEFGSHGWTILGTEAQLVHLDIDPDEIGKVYQPAVGLLGDANAGLQALLRALEQAGTPPPRNLEPIRTEYERQNRLPQSAEQTPVPSGALIQALQEVMDRLTVTIIQDASTFGSWANRYLVCRDPDGYLSAAGGSLGWGFPAAMGFKLARPERTVITVSGDGSFWMVAQDFETAVREQIPVVVIVCNNYCYGNTRDRQTKAHDGRYIGVFYQNLDFGAFAQMLGGHGERVSAAGELPAAIDRAIASGRPAIIDVVQSVWEGLPPGGVPGIG